MNNKNLLSFFIFCACGLAAPPLILSQSSSSPSSPSSPTVASENSLGLPEHAQLALSNPDYRVTPGDVYTLFYGAGTAQVKYHITVDTSYRVRIANLGIIDGRGKTFGQVKAQAETIVSNNYPLSGVQLVLTQPAIFTIYVRGEVKEATELKAWGLSRLSSLAGNHITDFSSLRDVSIRSAGGETGVYDLFKAERLGDISQDPYLRPGDVVTFGRVSRTVTVAGAVERPGRYQLLEGEQIRELIENYASGFTPVADRTRLELVRYVNSSAAAGQKVFLSESDYAANFFLEDYDTIMAPPITNLQPVMFVEGAVNRTAGDSPTGLAEGSPMASTRLVVQYNQGETYASLVRRSNEWFTAVSDTRNAYIIRGDEQIAMNLNPMLYDAEYRGSERVEENDTLIIPFRQYFVTVAGAVIKPGQYPYIPDRDWEYYIALAGGFIREKNAYQSVSIVDINGNKMKKGDVIGPETVITAKTNAFLYYFNQYAPPITAMLSIITTFLAISTQL
jgi:protein involved in polysaccharide export with SLBB domain